MTDPEKLRKQYEADGMDPFIEMWEQYNNLEHLMNRREAQLDKYGAHIFPMCPCTKGAPAKCQCGWAEIQKGLA